jgi:glycosyltransferase involved in cell wall biosynthesis
MKPDDRQLIIDVVIPVYNEEVVLEKSVTALRQYLQDNVPYRWRITIADNASRDRTWEIASRLSETYADVKALHLDRKGRGRALRKAWSESEALVMAYMDVDLSTGLEALMPMIMPLVNGERAVATGSRLLKGAQVQRQWKREVISRCYNLIIKAAFFNRFKDAQCGFKAVRTEIVQHLIPLVENNEWFFDTELLLLAERNYLTVHEVPVRWVEDLDSRVNIPKTVTEDLKGLWRVRRSFWRGGGYLKPAQSATLKRETKLNPRKSSPVTQ